MANQDEAESRRQDLIQKQAYEIYQARGGTDGLDVDDWPQAELDVDGLPSEDDQLQATGSGSKNSVVGGTLMHVYNYTPTILESAGRKALRVRAPLPAPNLNLGDRARREFFDEAWSMDLSCPE